ncbi:MAG: peptide MFS transporter [Bacteroidia bacterium]|nr:peptide MFS transporter [Bacteroidota bacterium]MBK8413467.1 peptide MFS transporter [Bacteroidota bacterium]MBP9083564.1 peptide MFS transporter [Bacteroidia bacterium]
MAQQASVNQGHPKGLYLLFFTEMWERFSYYGMRAIFILFMTKALFMSEAESSNIYGSVTGLVYLTPLLGGYIADKFWGNRKSILVGGILMAIGQFLLFFSGSAVVDGAQSASSIALMWGGLTFLIIGNGFFKPNISTMVGQLYPVNDSRIDGAFTIFYMGINMGAFFSPLICGGLGDTGNIHDFKYGFLAAGIGMVISTISFELLKNKHLVDPEGKPLGMPKAKMSAGTWGIILGSIAIIYALMNFQTIVAWIFGADAVATEGTLAYTVAHLDLVAYLIYTSMVVMPIVILTDKSLTKDERERIIVIFILAFFVVFFWACFEQAGASLTLFADQQVDRNIQMSVSKYIIMISGAVLGFFLAKAFGWFFDWSKKFILGIQVVIGALLLGLTLYGTIGDFHMTEFPASWFQSINPLAIIVLAPVFTMLWGKLAGVNMEPSSPLKMALGLALVALGYVIIAYAVHGVDSNTKIAMFWLFALYIVHTMGELCLSPIGLSMVSKLAPLRLSSLLMGTWFLANAAANKFAGTLSALIPPSAGDASAAPVAIPSFLGVEINNLFIFFCVFIVLSGSAAALLVVLYKKLIKMMHGVN